MIKFFRKIRKSMIKENRAGKYLLYAIGEIILVVIGILIALSINNWNNKQNEKRVEIKYLQGLKADLEIDLINLKGFIDDRKIKYTDANHLLKMEDPITITELIVTDSLIWNVFRWYTFSPRTNTLDELIGSGNLSLITNDSIKSKMQNVHQAYGKVDALAKHMRREYDYYLYDRSAQLRELSPFLDLDTLLDNYSVTFIYDKAEAELIELRRQSKAILNDLMFRNGLKFAALNTKVSHVTSELLYKDVEHLIHLMEQEIKSYD